MKKIFTFLIAIATVSFASAQTYHDHNDDYAMQKDRYYSSDRRHDDRGYDRNDNAYGYERRGYNERQRQEQVYRINHEYDQRITVCQNDRNMSYRERDRRIYRLNAERNQKIRSFGSGAAVGAVAGFLLGTIFSH